VQCDNYDTTAAFVAGLDLVITVGTSMHHLANAIGVPTWTLVPIRCGWRYGEKGPLWYRSTARFFRQHAEGDWSGAVADVAQALRRRYGKAEIAACDSLTVGQRPNFNSADFGTIAFMDNPA